MSRRRVAGLCAIGSSLTVLVLASALWGEACAKPPAVASSASRSEAARYLEDPAFRRAALRDSLVVPDNLYSRRRLASYREDVWDARPEWNPQVSLVREGTEGRSFAALRFTRGETREAALLELGKRAFAAYPLQVVPYVSHALDRSDVESRYGLALHEFFR